jgi:signal transduction histidine kinase
MLNWAKSFRTAVQWFTAIALALCLACGPSFAARWSELDHKSWTARNGAPPGITALALAADGVLWIGSEGGLFRFDGQSFTAFLHERGEPPLPAGPVQSMLAARDGAIWVGYRFGGMARISQRHIKLFAKGDQLQCSEATHIRQSLNGDIWVLCHQQELVRFGADGAWHMEITPRGSAGGRVHHIFIDSSDTLWLDQGGRLYRRPLGQSAYSVAEIRADTVYGFAELPDRSLWIVDTIWSSPGHPVGRTRRIDSNGRLLTQLSETGSNRSIIYTPDGSLILSEYGDGLQQVSASALIVQSPSERGGDGDRYRQVNGLSSDVEKAMLLDADGNIWAGGYGGLDRFRRAQLIAFTSKYGIANPRICGSNTGDMWISGGGTKDQLYKISGDATKLLEPRGQIYSISCGPDGDEYLVASTGIFKVRGDRITVLPLVPGIAAPLSIRQVVATPDHSLFASVTDAPDLNGIWRYAGGRWSKLTGRGIPRVMPYAEYVDSHGRLWTGNLDGKIGLPLQDGGRLLPSGNPGLGTVFAILETSYGLIAGGLNGLGVQRGNRFEMFNFAEQDSSHGIGGLVESADGDLWLSASMGVVHIPAAELRIALNTRGYPIKTELVAEGDFAGPIHLEPGVSGAGRDGKGRLWFATLNAVFHIDPKQLASRTHLPVVSITSIEADGKPVSADKAIGPGIQTLEIQYLGVNLTAPEKVTYRYRLDGLDTGWQDVRHRAVAIYSHLPPGTYRFQVMASNDGVRWTLPLSSKSITVAPFFYQTTWFLALCGLASMGLVWLLFSLRIRTLSASIRARAEERADERIRIARELHDTLLQGIQGLLLTFHVASQKVAPDAESKKLLDNALSTADRIILEGRNRVNSLRSEHLTDEELAGSLRNTGRDLALNDTTAFSVTREGIEAKLHAHVADEVFYIGREALTNAFRHSGAQMIVLHLAYGRRFFTMTCTDNGRGFDVDTHKPGHWGLKGMLERAQRLGGEMRFKSQPQNGVEIAVAIPAFRAYEGHSRLGSFFSAYRKGEKILQD